MPRSGPRGLHKRCHGAFVRQLFSCGSVKQQQDFFARRGRALKRVEFFGQIADGLEKSPDVRKKHHDKAIGNPVGADEPRAHINDSGNCKPPEKLDERPEYAVNVKLLHVRIEHGLVYFRELADLLLFLDENLHDPDARNAFV